MKNISYFDFKQLDIRIVEVIRAESIPHKNRILKLTVDIGSDETRTIVAGGAEFYSPEYINLVSIISMLRNSLSLLSSPFSDLTILLCASIISLAPLTTSSCDIKFSKNLSPGLYLLIHGRRPPIFEMQTLYSSV